MLLFTIMRLTIFLLLASLFFPCATAGTVIPSKMGPSKFKRDIINAFKNMGNDSIISAFKGVPELRASDLQKTYYLPLGKQAKLDVLLSNQMPSPVNYVVLCCVLLTIDKSNIILIIVN